MFGCGDIRLQFILVIAGGEYHPDTGFDLLDALNRHDAAEPRHDDIRDDQRNALLLLLKPVDRIDAVDSLQDPVTDAFQYLLCSQANDLIIIHDKYGFTVAGLYLLQVGAVGGGPFFMDRGQIDVKSDPRSGVLSMSMAPPWLLTAP